MGLFDRLRGQKISGVKMIELGGNAFYGWNGKVYQSDIVRAAIRPYVQAVGKLVGKHIRESITADGARHLTINPDAHIRFLLEEPNPLMTGQMMQEKLATHLILNNNAFAVIHRNPEGLPMEIYPVCAISAEAVERGGELALRFTMRNGDILTVNYRDIIHLRRDYNEDDLFGSPLAPVLTQLMEIVSTTDQGIVKAIKNSAVIRWLLKFTNSLRPEDQREQARQFAESFMSVENGSGVAVVDSKADAIQISPENYVPNAAQMDKATERIYALFNTNTKIVTSARSEDEWNAYFDAEIEPVLLQLQGEYTRKLFTRMQRGFGNRIAFEASSWDSASIGTKLNLMQMVDRGALTANEWRATLNLAPLPGGDTVVRRLDTAPTTQKGGEESA